MSATIHLDSGPRDPSPLCGASGLFADVTTEINDVTCSQCEAEHERLTEPSNPPPLTVGHLSEPGQSGPLCKPDGVQPSDETTTWIASADAAGATCSLCWLVHDQRRGPKGECTVLACTCEDDGS